MLCRKCPGDQTYNSKTSRCVSKKSPTGKNIEMCKREKIKFVMKEFKDKNLKSSNGKNVTSQKQAIAIALSIACKNC